MPNIDPSDRAAIHDLLAAYCHRIDVNDVDGLVALFTADCRVDFGPELGAVEGVERLRRSFGAVGRFFAATTHLVTNVLVTPSGPDLAEVASSFHAWHRYRDGRPDSDLWGQYHDVVVHRDGRWLIHARELRVAGSRNFHASDMLPLDRHG